MDSAQEAQADSHVIVGVDPLPHVVQQGGQKEFFVVGDFLVSQAEDLQAVVQHVPFGV